MRKRTILHCDLNCFFASVEMLYNPELRNIPMAVAGDPENRHGIILAKNVLAKKKGIKTAESINEALRKCPELLIRKPDYNSYQYFSELVRNLYYEFTDRVEPFGMDECWLDITESISYFGSVQNIVDQLLYRIRNEIGLTLSIGIADNKIYAKLGSDLATEDSFRYINSLEEIRHMPADALLNVGYHTYETLKTFGIYTIGDIADKPAAYLNEILGKYGNTLYCYANGNDLGYVGKIDDEHEEIKSISNSMTSVRDLYNIDDFKIILTVLCDSVSTRLREHGLYYRTIHLIVRNNKLEVRTMQTSLKENSDLGKDIFDNAVMLFERNCDFSIPYRSIGVAVSKLSSKKDICQTSLFEKETYSLKQKKQEVALEQIRKRFGVNSISSLRVLEDSDLSHFTPKEEKEYYSFHNGR
ncbi:MAG: DNA polymerase IV [Erysipelotrichaceae bacterium]|nr:DNA polymerase IV [Erysipelotrichaceae bacterium]